MSRDKFSSQSEACEEQLNFEKLLTDLSVRFINIPADEVDSEIDAAQHLICGMLEIDQATLWQLSDDTPPVLVITHLYSDVEVPDQKEEFSHDAFPWVRDELLAGRQVKLSSMDEFPEEAAIDHKTALLVGIKSSLSFPLSVGGGGVIGVLGFNTLKREREWPEELVSRLGVLAQIFSNAIGRKQAEQTLRQSEARLELAADSANAGLWSLDLSTERYWMTDASRVMFGFSAGELVSFPQVLEHIHPEDREKVMQVVHRAVASGDEERVDYRITLDDGTVRWMVSRGRVQHGSNGSNDLLMGVTLDITETKEKAERLRVSENRIASAIEVAELGFYEVVDGREFTFMDNLGQDIMGLSANVIQYSEILQFWAAHIHSEDRPRIMELQRLQREFMQDKVTGEYRYQHPTRGSIWIHHLSHVLERDANGHTLRTIGVLRDITRQKTSEEEVQKLRKQLEMENLYLREQLKRDDGQDAIVGESEPVLRMLNLAKQVAPTDSTVLVTGETGTGKELLAQAIHDLSPRKARSMIKVNCAALPASLIEGELFGREKGAYTGAMTQQHGRFEVADGSSIFLDEIGDLPLGLQAKLLRVLQDGRFERLGSTQTLQVDVRVIAATNHDLSEMVREGTFREDLFHRLNVFPIEVPPLRTRVSDIPLMTWKFVQEFNAKMGRSIESIPKQTIERMQSYPWPGNVRELRNMVERAMIISEGRSLKMEFSTANQDLDQLPTTLEEMERNHIVTVLKRTNWRVRGKDGAAEILRLNPSTLYSRMKKLGISRPNS